MREVNWGGGRRRWTELRGECLSVEEANDSGPRRGLAWRLEARARPWLTYILDPSRQMEFALRLRRTLLDRVRDLRNKQRTDPFVEALRPASSIVSFRQTAACSQIPSGSET